MRITLAFVYVSARCATVLAKSTQWQRRAATRLASVARDAFLPSGERDERESTCFAAAVRFLLTRDQLNLNLLGESRRSAFSATKQTT